MPQDYNKNVIMNMREFDDWKTLYREMIKNLPDRSIIQSALKSNQIKWEKDFTLFARDCNKLADVGIVDYRYMQARELNGDYIGTIVSITDNPLVTISFERSPAKSAILLDEPDFGEEPETKWYLTIYTSQKG